ncbi:hypothetical protein E9840_08405 [Tissierella creatinini]|nr:hypothetical protein E9840_08405 [Tissierella creatinini]TJX64594.1 hypothetical protein E8P77_11760 [Soehngenia saccharolytica]
MEDNKIFRCGGNEGESIPESILENFNMSFEEINHSAANMAMLSKQFKENKNSEYCILPFCSTVEAESFGSKVIYNPMLGNRIEKYAIDETSQVDELARIDLSKGRIAEVLEALKLLKEKGEKVTLNVTGPISIATSIMDSHKFYKLIRRDAERADKLLKTIEDSVVDYILEGVKRGVDIISYADPTGGIDILGPRVYKEVSGKSTYNILKRVEGQLDQAIIHLCGKTSTSLESIGLLETERIQVEGKNYFEMIRNVKKDRGDVSFLGHWCMKNQKKNNIVVSCMLV